MRSVQAAAALVLAALAGPAMAAPGFSQWAAVVVSGDDEASDGQSFTPAFDNARRDISRALVGEGFSPANIEQLSVEPDLHPGQHSDLADLGHLRADLRRLARRAPAGCLVYLTSHGSPDGAVLGDALLTPSALERSLNAACGARPTVVVISTCFSGAFIAALAGPDRMILTAARKDRSSFGCGVGDEYPYFDACVLGAWPLARDFAALAADARRCVARRELAEHLSPPSRPQTWIGPRFHAPAFGTAR